jgi:hypothetical protein
MPEDPAPLCVVIVVHILLRGNDQWHIFQCPHHLPTSTELLEKKTSNESVSSPFEEYCEIVHLKADS